MLNEKCVYFDNSATTRPKPKSVILKSKYALEKYNCNPGRSGHFLSVAVEEKIFDVRQSILEYVGGDNVIFSGSCTESLNLAILGTAKSGGHIVITENEHNSVLRCIERLKNTQRISYSIARCKYGKVYADEIEKYVNEKTYLVIANPISNVNGDEDDFKAIGKLCKQKGILFLIDGAQCVGHEKVNYFDIGVDMLSIASHKGLYAMQGCGALVIRNGVKLSPIKFGGTGTSSLLFEQPTEIPEGFECGTLPTPSILTIKDGLHFVNEYQDFIPQNLENLSQHLCNALLDMNYDVYTTHYNGVVAFNHKLLDSNQLSDFLSKRGICTRSGLHCAPLKHQMLGTTKKGAVRASFSVFNNLSELKYMIDVLNELK